MAASSISRGTDAKKPLRIQTANGSTNERYSTTRTVLVSSSPNVAATRYRGMTVEMAGSIRVARMSVMIVRPPRIGMRARA